MTRHFLEIDDLAPDELRGVLDLASLPVAELPPVLDRRGVALVFEKPSARTRSSSELAVAALGGHPVTIGAVEVGIDTRETAEDVARTLACYHAVLCARVLRHETLVRMAGALDTAGIAVPVVNLLSDQSHPCQALADLLTLRQELGELAGRTVAYIGDANNVWRSLAFGCAMAGVAVRTASPAEHAPAPDDMVRLRQLGGTVHVTVDPVEAVAGADAIYTDVWTSMGQENEAAARRRAFAGFTVDEDLLRSAPSHAVVLHCLPAHRGEEISAAVLDGTQSRVWRQAANRMHAMRGLLAWLAAVEGWSP